MKLSQPPRRLAVGIVASLAACGSWALTVGRPQGLALIGRPLEVSVPIALDGAGEPLPECPSVEIFYGDTRLSSDRVSSELVPAPSGATLRVRSSWSINEPVVTLYVQLGCSNRVSRRVVLLAEQPDVQGEIPRALAPAGLAAAPRPAARDARSAERIRPAPQSASRAAGTAPEPTVDALSARRSRPMAAGIPIPRKAAAAAPPRLKLEPLDLSAPAEPALRLSAMLAAPAQEATPQQRAVAGAMWRALNAQPDNLLRDAQRLESLEKDLRSLRVSIQRNDIALAEVKGDLQKAQSERYANPLVYVLALLALAGAGAAGWLWRRRQAEREAAAWWRPPHHPSRDSDAPRTSPRPPPAPDLSAGPHSEPLVDVDLAERHAAPSGPPPAMPVPAPALRSFAPSSDFHASQPSSLRALRAEELHDVQQEADFFVSLGEYERAIEVLRSHISMNPETSAMAWLDLLEIFHKLGRHDDFDWVRGEFQRQFNAKVPPFEHYRQEDTGLEGYEKAMSRIVALWPSRRVLDVIEESIFRGPGQGSGAFSLQAYRELLLLHHIGSEVMGRETETSARDFTLPGGLVSGFGATGGFSATNISPLSAGPASQTGLASLPGVGAYSDIGLDINLDEPAAAGEVIGAAPAVGDSHLLDFDLPDVDSGWQPRKTHG